MLIRPPSDVAASEITPREIYLRRREFLRGAAALGLRSSSTTRSAGPRRMAPSSTSSVTPVHGASTNDSGVVAIAGPFRVFIVVLRWNGPFPRA